MGTQNAAGWMLEVVLDYGEHDALDPRPRDDLGWLARNDPFSTYRAGSKFAPIASASVS